MPTAKAREAVAGEPPSIAMARVQSRGWYLVASALPLAACAAVLLAEVDDARPFELSRFLLRKVMSGTLLLEALIVVVAAPLAGVGVAKRRLQSNGAAHVKVGALGRASGALSPLARAIGVFVGVSAVIALWGFGLAHDAWPAIVVSHATLGTAALALGALGALVASLFRDELDAAVCSVSVALVAACGLLAAGTVAGDLPTPVINAALLASPIVATASAANIDILRSDLLYRLSPLAHRRFDYPAWQDACALYLAVAACCFFWVALRTRPPDPVVTTECPKRAEANDAI